MILISHPRRLILKPLNNNIKNNTLRGIAIIPNHTAAVLLNDVRGIMQWLLMHARGVFQSHIHLLGKYFILF